MKILLIAYYFPPDSSSGSFRPLFFANHLTELGDEVTILTARQEDFLTEQPIDMDVLRRLDQRVRVVRGAVYRPKEFLLKARDFLTGKPSIAIETVHSAKVISRSNKIWSKKAKDFITDLITTPDQQAGWIFSCVRLGLSVIRRWRPDVILATGGPWSGLVAGSLLKRLTGIPLVLDFRDPWLSNPFQNFRSSIINRIDTYLEKYVILNANLVIANTEELKQDFMKNYPNLRQEHVITITNGFEDYLPESTQKLNKHLTLTHAGDFYFPRSPRSLLEALKNTIERGMIDPTKIKLRFIGGMTLNDPSIERLLTSQVLSNIVDLKSRVPYAESLRAMTESDILILYPLGLLQIPRKLYDYMAAQRPVLCIADPGSAARLMVERFSLGSICDDDISQLEIILVDIYDKWINGNLETQIDKRCEPFRNYNLTMRLRNFLELIT